jgi:hypothetical protein
MGAHLKTQAGEGAWLMVLVHHDDVTREFAYGPDSKIGTFSDALLAVAKERGWVVISMQSDWPQTSRSNNNAMMSTLIVERRESGSA